MIVPIADAYYEASVPEKAGEDKELMKKNSNKYKEKFERSM